MAEIKILLHSDLCPASGESTGNAIDMDVTTDRWGIPYIPARRIKGCLRKAAEDLAAYGCSQATEENIRTLFGDADGKAGALIVENACLPDIEALRGAVDQARRDELLKESAAPGKITELFTYVRGSTAMQDGKAKDGSLRFERVIHHYSSFNPGKENCFICLVRLLNPDVEELLKMCCKATRHIGSGRNRGLGNVSLVYRPDEAARAEEAKSAEPLPEERCRVNYKVLLNAPLVMAGLQHKSMNISSRAVIGCMAETWLKTEDAGHPTFDRLFLSGEIIWQDLTPMIDGQCTFPAPRMIVRLKDTNICENVLSSEKHAEGKRKLLDGNYAAFREDGFAIASSEKDSAYHHSTAREENEGTLYVEESIKEGYLYGGEVTVPKELLPDVLRLLHQADFRFGRSKSAQYGACRLAEEPVVVPARTETAQVSAGETVYAVLLSDLILCEAGMNTAEPDSVRAAIADHFCLNNIHPKDGQGKTIPDSCAYTEIGGYHLQWQLRKPVYEAVKAGSYYCFTASGDPLPREGRIGEYPQEGKGRIRLFSAKEMNGMNRMVERTIERGREQAAPSDEMTRSILVRAAEKSMDQTAMNYVRQHSKLNKKIQIGRLRLMVSEAKDYADLKRRVSNIKTISYREASLSFLQELFGSGEAPDGARMLQGNPKLWEKMDENAKKIIAEEWKRPLARILSLAHYQEGDGKL